MVKFVKIPTFFVKFNFKIFGDLKFFKKLI